MIDDTNAVSLGLHSMGLGRRISLLADKVGGKKKLAQLCDISESHLYRYIAGASEPTASRLAALAKVGNVSLDWLITGAEVASPAGPMNSAKVQNQLKYVVDSTLLEKIILTVESQADDLNAPLSAQRRSRIYAVVYSLCLNYDEKISTDDAVIKHLISLVIEGRHRAT